MVLQGGTISITWDCMRHKSWPHRRLKGSETLGVEPSHQLHKPSRQFRSTLAFENHWLIRWRIALIERSQRCAAAVKGVPDKKFPDLCESSWSTCLASPEHCVNGEWPSAEGPHSYHLAIWPWARSYTWFLTWKMKDPLCLLHRIVMRCEGKHAYKHTLSTRKYWEKMKDVSFCRLDSRIRAWCQGREWGERLYLSFPRSSTFLSIQWLIHHFGGCVSGSAIQPTNLSGVKTGKPCLISDTTRGYKNTSVFRHTVFYGTFCDGRPRRICMWTLRVSCPELVPHQQSISTLSAPCEEVMTFKKHAKCPLTHRNHCKEDQKENPSSKPNLQKSGFTNQTS